MKIIVTGGAGFIGSHIVDAYIKRGHRVCIIDNLATGNRKNLNTKAKFYKADIRDGKEVERIFKKERPHVVSHHAAIASVALSLRDPLAILNTNVLGTASVARAFGLYGRGKKKFIFASTGGVMYGNPKKLPANEKTPAAPTDPYGLSKVLGERVITFYAREFAFSYLALRYSNVYGPRQNPKGEAGVVAIFGELMLRRKQPTIFGDGTKTRDYLYVQDIVRANVSGLSRGKDDVLNLGRGIAVKDIDIFRAVASETAFRKPPRYAPFRKGEVRRISLDAKKAGRVLRWRPEVSLEEGIHRTIQTLR